MALDKTLRRNTTALLIAQFANYVLPFVTFPYLTRVLGPEQFGAIAFALAVVTFVSLIAEYGFSLSAAQRLAKITEKDGIGRIFWSVMVVKTVLVLGSSLFCFSLTYLIPKFALDRTLICVALLVAIPGAMMPAWYYQVTERSATVAKCAIASRVLSVPLLLFFVKSPSDAWISLLIGNGLPVLLMLSLWYIFLKEKWIPFQKVTLASCLEELKDGWHIFTSNIAISLYTQLNTVLLGFLSGNSQVALFSASDKFRAAAQNVTSPFSNAFYPRITKEISNNPSAALELMKKLVTLQSGATLVIGLIFFFCAEIIVSLLMGPQFSHAVVVMRWMAPIPFIVSLSNILGIQLMLPLGMKIGFSRILLFSGVVNVAGLLLLAEPYGAAGAAASVLLTELIVTCLMAVTVWRSQEFKLFWRTAR